MNVLLVNKVNILMFSEWLDIGPKSSRLLSLEWLAYSEHVIQSLPNICSFGVCF